MASAKVQLEDDITASVVVSASALTGLNPDYKNHSVKLVDNCEQSFFSVLMMLLTEVRIYRLNWTFLARIILFPILNH